MPARVAVTPAGAKVRLVLLARLAGRWVRLARTGYTDTDGTGRRVAIRLTSHARGRIGGRPVKARLVVTATTADGFAVRDTATFTVVR